MIGLLVVTHGNLGACLIEGAEYILGHTPEQLLALDLTHCAEREELRELARASMRELDQGDGVLILADIYGATPCNTVCQLIETDRVAAVAGVNLPMLLKAITYRQEPLEKLADRAMEGGQAGIFHISVEQCHA
ncbi:MAG TPA: PTS fructose transporter subunit IIA [Thiobacillaceae bacterium]|nr:PTS fructose transporter subunit IIA [Thiobacillaceae bacterium]